MSGHPWHVTGTEAARPAGRRAQAPAGTRDEDNEGPYAPDEEGYTPALSGEWRGVEHFARWLAKHSEEGGRAVLHSQEADGAAWGWEFDGRGRMRSLDLVKTGKWE